MAWNRKIEVTVESENKPSITITDLHIEFEVFKTMEKAVNTAEIKIYNPSDDTVSNCSKLKDKLILKAGYEDEAVQNLFLGIITKSNFYKEGVDTILEIHAKDGYSKVRDVNMNISFDKNAKVKEILNAIITELNIPLNKPLPSMSYVYSNGYSFIGKAVDALTEVLSFVGMKWTLENTQLLLFYDDESIPSPPVITLSKDSGLLHSPESIKNANEKKGKKDRYDIICLLTGQVQLLTNIRLESEKVTGEFLILKLRHIGSNFDEDFFTELEVEVK